MPPIAASPLAAWPRDLTAARALQKELAGRVEIRDRLDQVRTVAGVDVSYPRAPGPPHQGLALAAVVMLDLATLKPVEWATATMPPPFPYRSGYLSFREVPPAVAALERLSRPPDVVLCDGQGLAHPRRLGLACHLGVVTGLPTVGVAKSRLVGEHGAVPPCKGQWVEMTHQGEVVGAVLRTREGVKPVYVSPGHRVGLATAIRLTMACVTRFRLPETTRLSHRLAAGHAPTAGRGRAASLDRGGTATRLGGRCSRR